MEDGTVLHIGALTNNNVVHIATCCNHMPNAAVGPDANVTDQTAGVSNIYLITKGRADTFISTECRHNLLIKRVIKHGNVAGIQGCDLINGFIVVVGSIVLLNTLLFNEQMTNLTL